MKIDETIHRECQALNQEALDKVKLEIKSNHVASACYYSTPNNARARQMNFALFGVILKNNAFEVWSSYDEDDAPEVLLDGIFQTQGDAVQFAKNRANELMKIAADWVNYLKNDEMR